MAIELRDYQQECVKRVLASYAHNPSGTELLVLPTGGGKTIVFSAVIDHLHKQHGLAAMVVAHRDELLDQAADKYRMIQPNAIIGKIGSGLHQYGAQVSVCGIATISKPEHLKRLSLLYGTGRGLIIIVDEAHHVAAPGYQAVLEAFPDAFTLFVTATPDRLDNKPILNKQPLFEKSILEMIRQRYLCDIKCIAVKTKVDLSQLHTQAGDFKPGELSDAVDSTARNTLIVQKYQEHTPGKRAVAFCVTVEHAKHLAEAFNEAGIAAEVVVSDPHLDMKRQIEIRKAIYQRFRSGQTLVMCNVMVLSEGWDEPLCEVGIGARPTQSRALFVQQLGRILRLAPGKEFATWLEVTDNCFNHRLEPQSLRKVLKKHFLKENETILESEERIRLESEEREAQVRKIDANRDRDLNVNLLEKLHWQERPDGKFVLEVGREKHRIALIPEENGNYSVYARLFPGYEAQCWLSAQPLDWAQQLAEKKAGMLLADPKAVGLVDRNAGWRKYPVDPDGNQVKFLKWKKIPWHPGMTKGEASDLIDEWKRKDEAKKAAKEARAKARVSA